MKILKRVLCSVTAAVMLMCGTAFNTAAADDIAHDQSRDVQAEGVGNPFNYG